MATQNPNTTVNAEQTKNKDSTPGTASPCDHETHPIVREVEIFKSEEDLKHKPLDKDSKPYEYHLVRRLSSTQQLHGGSRRRSSEDKHCHDAASKLEQLRLEKDQKAKKQLIFASALCLFFMFAEAIGGYMANSLAIATDAVHLLTDFASFMISLIALWLATRPASTAMSFGWYRAEVIGALVSVLMIWLMTGFLVKAAYERVLANDYEIDAKVMLITAGLGIIVNLIMAISLQHGHSHGGGASHGHSHGADSSRGLSEGTGQRHSHDGGHGHSHDDGHGHSHDGGHGHSHDGGHGHSHAADHSHSQSINNSKVPESDDGNGHDQQNVNVRAAMIHVIGDFIQSIGVFVAALVIYYYPEYRVCDPICTFIFSVLVLITTANILKDTINVLMEGIPTGVNFFQIHQALSSVPGVLSVHNLRIWGLSMDKIAMSAHIVVDDKQNATAILRACTRVIRKRQDIFELTLQIEEYHKNMSNCKECQNVEIAKTPPLQPTSN